MKRLFLPLCLSLLCFEAQASQKCRDLFYVPAEFESLFSVYRDHMLATPLNFKSYSAENGIVITVEGNGHEASSDELPKAEMRLSYPDQESTQSIAVDSVTMSPFLPVEYVHKVLIAHLFNVRTLLDVRSVKYVFQGDGDEALLRERVVRGWTVRKAIKRSGAYRAFAAFGFKLDSFVVEPVELAPHPHQRSVRIFMNLRLKPRDSLPRVHPLAVK